MIENYKLDKLIGPSGNTAGYILLLFGMVTIYFTLTAIPVLLIGGILVFSYQGTRIKFENKRYQSYLMLFGFIRIGAWLPFEKSDLVLVKRFKGKYTSYSWSNRKNEMLKQDFRIMLSTSYNDKKILLARFESEQEAREKAKELESMINSL